MLTEDEQGVTLTFEPVTRVDGTTETPPPMLARRCVVGADGVHSKVRDIIVGDGDARYKTAAYILSSACLIWRGDIAAQHV